MEFKHVKLLSFIFLLFQFLFANVHAKSDAPNHLDSSPFGFINQLNGLHKGMVNTKGVQQVKNYLKQLGYLENPKLDDNFDDALESANKTYQQNYHINPTGVLDSPTILQLAAPRCGVPDIVNGFNTMLKKEKHESNSNSIRTVSNYNTTTRRWPASKMRLTYDFKRNTAQPAKDAVARAFQTWAASTRFSFSPVARGQKPDLNIGFYRGYHGDNSPFWPGTTVLAHAFYPTNGRFHYNADKPWADGLSSGRYDYESVAVHEIGHLLGLNHSGVADAIMYPTIGAGLVKTTLDQDDLDGITAREKCKIGIPTDPILHFEDSSFSGGKKTLYL